MVSRRLEAEFVGARDHSPTLRWMKDHDAARIESFYGAILPTGSAPGVEGSGLRALMATLFQP